jgi:hypothetical protein
MAAKTTAATTTPPQAKRRASGPTSKGRRKAGPPPIASASTAGVVAQNLINMVVVATQFGDGAAGTDGRQAFSDRAVLNPANFKPNHRQIRGIR